MTEPSVTVDRSSSGVATVTLNRPSRCNAIDDQSITLMTEIMVRLDREATVKSIIITGTGQFFCAGLDIAWMEALNRRGNADDGRRLATLLMSIRESRKPVIARINGPAIGAGLGLAAACDLSVARDDAVFSLPAVKVGVVPAVVAPFIMAAVGPSLARRYLMTGESLDAEEARRVGLIQACCHHVSLDETVAQFASLLGEASPHALAETKTLLNALTNAPLNAKVLSDAATVSASSRRHADAAEGLNAFIEKRPAAWAKGSKETD